MTDTGRDDLGPFRPPEELNEFNPAGPVVNFGFPGCYGQGGQACAGMRPPLATFGAHASPAGVAVKGDVAFVVENGSSFRAEPDGERHPARRPAHRTAHGLLALAGQA